MKRAVILHGTLGSPESNWFRWLEKELIDRNLEVWLPALPHADQPSLNEWAEYVHQNCPFELDENTLIVGHSSGAILALILTQRVKNRVGGIVCVSAFHDNSLNWEPNNKLFDTTFHFQLVKAKAEAKLFVHSDDDPYVPLEQATYVAESVAGELLVIPGQGHFNLEKSNAYKQFPRLLKELEVRHLT